MELVIGPSGQVSCLYDEVVDLTVLGPLLIRRASYVEPDSEGRWRADLTPVAGPKLGPFGRRSEALEAERQWLEAHWLARLDKRPLISGSFPKEQPWVSPSITV